MKSGCRELGKRYSTVVPLRAMFMNAFRSPVLALFFGTAGLGTAQNLVLNGSFEEYTECPPSFDYWANVIGWTSPFTESADYYNACAGGVVCSVPFNTAGYQYPAHGQGYMGLFTWATLMGGYYREVIATQLLQPLQPGVPVYVSYKASPGGFGSNPNNSATLAAKGLGMNFFTTLPNDWQEYLFPNSAAVDMPTVLSDTSSWVTINGTYVPDSACSWLAITNFFENSFSQTQVLDEIAPANFRAYAFIDDVCVSQDPLFCSLGTGIDRNGSDQHGLFGNLFDGRLKLSASNTMCDAMLSLSDVQGTTYGEVSGLRALPS